MRQFFTNSKNVAVSVGLILFGIVIFMGFYNNQVIENPYSLPADCQQVMGKMGINEICPDSNLGWRNFFVAHVANLGDGVDWPGKMYTALVNCPETCKRITCTCKLDFEKFSAVWGDYKPLLDAAIAARLNQHVYEQPADDAAATTELIIPLADYVSAILIMVGLATLLGLAALPIPFLKDIGSKVSASTLYLIVVLVMKDKDAATFGIMANPIAAKIVWTSFWFLIGSPFFSLAAFGLGALAKAVRSSGEGWVILLTTPAATVISTVGTVLALAPQIAVLIAALMAIQSGIADPLLVIKASLFGSLFLAPGVTGLFGDLYAFLGLMVPAMKLDSMMK